MFIVQNTLGLVVFDDPRKWSCRTSLQTKRFLAATESQLIWIESYRCHYQNIGSCCQQTPQTDRVVYTWHAIFTINPLKTSLFSSVFVSVFVQTFSSSTFNWGSCSKGKIFIYQFGCRWIWLHQLEGVGTEYAQKVCQLAEEIWNGWSFVLDGNWFTTFWNTEFCE